MEKFNLLSAKTEAEAIFSKLKSMQAFPSDQEFDLIGKLRSAFKSYFKNKNSNCKKFKPFLKALRIFAKKSGLYVSRFDKGNGVVIDKKENYVDKMMTILNDESKFKAFCHSSRSDKNPFVLYEENFNRSLLRLRNAGDINDQVYHKIRSNGSQPARLYPTAYLKCSKTGVTYLPILNMCNSYSSNLSLFLDKLLKPSIPSKFTVKDTFKFADKMKALTLSENEFFVSFDAISLFTNVPVNSIIDHILSVIDAEDLPFSKQTLKELLLLACTNVLFTFNDQLFIQHEGVCMGSTLGPTMAAFAMDMIESKFETYKGHLPSVYLRYVDDCLALFTSRDEALNFLEFLNSHHPSLQFTIEFEVNETINFLDTKIKRANGAVEVDWSIKDTNTGIYTPFCSYTPFGYKIAAMRCLFYRAKRICSDHLYDKAADQIV